MSSYISCPKCYGIGEIKGLGHMTNQCPNCQGIKYVPISSTSQSENKENINKPILKEENYTPQEKVNEIIESITPVKKRGRPAKFAI